MSSVRSAFSTIRVNCYNIVPSKASHVTAKLVHSFSLSAFKVLEDKGAEFIKRCKKSFTIVCFGKLLYKTLQVGVACYHKRGDRYFQLLTLSCQVYAPVHHLPVEAEAVFIITFANF